MKKLIDKKIVYVALVLLGLGIISGIVFFLITSKLDKIIIKSEITEYVALTSKGVSFSSFFNSFKFNTIYVIVITFISVLYIFSPIILFINYYKGLLIGFFISSVILTYKVKGIMYSFVMMFPHQFIMAILIVIYSSIMFNISLKLIRGTLNKESVNLNLFVKKIGVLFIISLFVCALCSVLEVTLNSYLVNLIDK